jgi:hypothetical protein
MQNIAGIFDTKFHAMNAVRQLENAGVDSERINLLTPDTSSRGVAGVPTTETEQEGMGGVVGGVVGGSLGAASGLSLGAAAASLLVPGVGAVVAFGLAGAALLATGGAIGGVAAGKALEDAMSLGLPIDELYVYEDALRHGRSVVIAFGDEKELERARYILIESGAESIDSAREKWWVGLRDNEDVLSGELEKQDQSDDGADTLFRSGFEAAFHPRLRGKSYTNAQSTLAEIYDSDFRKPAFKRGYERGQRHYQNLVER